jgi:hypothetical protein
MESTRKERRKGNELTHLQIQTDLRFLDGDVRVSRAIITSRPSLPG